MVGTGGSVGPGIDFTVGFTAAFGAACGIVAPGAGAEFSGAPTALSQRWPGSPWAGFSFPASAVCAAGIAGSGSARSSSDPSAEMVWVVLVAASVWVVSAFSEQLNKKTVAAESTKAEVIFMMNF